MRSTKSEDRPHAFVRCSLWIPYLRIGVLFSGFRTTPGMSRCSASCKVSLIHASRTFPLSLLGCSFFLASSRISFFGLGLTSACPSPSRPTRLFRAAAWGGTLRLSRLCLNLLEVTEISRKPLNGDLLLSIRGKLTRPWLGVVDPPASSYLCRFFFLLVVVFGPIESSKNESRRPSSSPTPILTSSTSIVLCSYHSLLFCKIKSWARTLKLISYLLVSPTGSAIGVWPSVGSRVA